MNPATGPRKAISLRRGSPLGWRRPSILADSPLANSLETTGSASNSAVAQPAADFSASNRPFRASVWMSMQVPESTAAIGAGCDHDGRPSTRPALRAMPASDAELVVQIARGDRAAFTALVRRWETPTHRLAYRITGCSADADEVRQDVFLKLLDGRGRLPCRPERFA